MPRKPKKYLGHYIVVDPEICHGKPTFLGTRIMVSQVLRQVAKGLPVDDIMAEWQSSISQNAIDDAVEFAGRSIVE